ASAAFATPSRAAAAKRTIVVWNAAGFAQAAKKLSATGGTIRLRPGRYASLTLGPRSARTLRVVGSRGTRVGRFLLAGTQHVSIGKLAIAPVAGGARLELQGA